jgi:hypothetical protein
MNLIREGINWMNSLLNKQIFINYRRKIEFYFFLEILNKKSEIKEKISIDIFFSDMTR